MRLIRRQYNYRKDVNKNVNLRIKKNSWGSVSSFPKILSEKFIEKYKDKVYWTYISYYQKLSENFIERHKDKVYWNLISTYQKLSPEFREKWKHKCV